MSHLIALAFSGCTDETPLFVVQAPTGTSGTLRHAKLLSNIQLQNLLHDAASGMQAAAAQTTSAQDPRNQAPTTGANAVIANCVDVFEGLAVLGCSDGSIVVMKLDPEGGRPLLVKVLANAHRGGVNRVHWKKFKTGDRV